MNINIKLKELEYENLFKSVIPVLEKNAENSSGLKHAMKILKITGDIPTKVILAIPQKKKDEIVVNLVNHYNEKIKKLIEDNLREKGFIVKIENFKITL